MTMKKLIRTFSMMAFVVTSFMVFSAVADDLRFYEYMKITGGATDGQRVATGYRPN